MTCFIHTCWQLWLVSWLIFSRYCSLTLYSLLLHQAICEWGRARSVAHWRTTGRGSCWISDSKVSGTLHVLGLIWIRGLLNSQLVRWMGRTTIVFRTSCWWLCSWVLMRMKTTSRTLMVRWYINSWRGRNTLGHWTLGWSCKNLSSSKKLLLLNLRSTFHQYLLCSFWCPWRLLWGILTLSHLLGSSILSRCLAICGTRS